MLGNPFNFVYVQLSFSNSQSHPGPWLWKPWCRQGFVASRVELSRTSEVLEGFFFVEMDTYTNGIHETGIFTVPNHEFK